MSSTNMTSKLVTLAVPADFDFDPFEYAVGFQTIASLAARCLDSGEGTVNADLHWSIIRLAERFERELKSVREPA